MLEKSQLAGRLVFVMEFQESCRFNNALTLGTRNECDIQSSETNYSCECQNFKHRSCCTAI